MSGGHWSYLSRDYVSLADLASPNVDAGADRRASASEALIVLAAIESELDWGCCSDTCYSCAIRRVVPALEALFDEPDSSTAAAAIVRDRDNIRLSCDRCLSRLARSFMWPEPSPETVVAALIEIAHRREVRP